MVAVAAAVALTVPAAASGKVVLGSKDWAAPYGEGWGTAKPRKIDNGGVPSGIVVKIRWRHWSDAIARGKGRGHQYKPGGGYYRKRVDVKLRAQRIGTCPGEKGRAYKHLKAKFRKRPGGPYGDWFSWSGDKNLCTYP